MNAPPLSEVAEAARAACDEVLKVCTEFKLGDGEKDSVTGFGIVGLANTYILRILKSIEGHGRE